jgi:hypothetical protein
MQVPSLPNNVIQKMGIHTGARIAIYLLDIRFSFKGFKGVKGFKLTSLIHDLDRHLDTGEHLI